MAGKPDRFEAARLVKLEKMKDLGLDPFGQRFDGHISIREAREQCPDEPGTEGAEVRIAGRLMTRRKAGKLRFFRYQGLVGENPVAVQSWRPATGAVGADRST